MALGTIGSRVDVIVKSVKFRPSAGIYRPQNKCAHVGNGS